MSHTTAEESMAHILKQAGYERDSIGIYDSGRGGYWSHFSQEDNHKFLQALNKASPQLVVREMIPDLYDLIFSTKREAALDLLEIGEGDVCIDYGCMWGVLSIGMAKRGGRVLAVDQTRESLQFLTKRLSNEDLPNVTCIRDDLRVIDLEGVADVAVVNGVLEWVAEPDPIELGRFYGKEVERSPTVTQNPDRIQDDFLRRVRKSLRNGGRLMLAIENRYDYSQFIGKRDPHSNLFFTSFAPRHISDQLSRLILKRPYVNFLHSFSGLNKKLLKAGFHEVDLYAVFPNYRFPDLILPYVGGLRDYRRTLGQSPSRRRKLVSVVEAVLMKSLKARFLAPSIIAIAKV